MMDKENKTELEGVNERNQQEMHAIKDQSLKAKGELNLMRKKLATFQQELDKAKDEKK